METLLGAISIGSSIAGMFKTFQGQSDLKNATNEEIAAEQKKLELQRTMQQLEFNRQQRSTVRQSIMARAQARSTAVNQGAAQPGSSALGGAIGGISGVTANKQTALSQNLIGGQQQIGNEYQMLAAERDVASAQGELSMGQGLMQLGQGVANQTGNLTKLGNTGMNFFKGLFPSG